LCSAFKHETLRSGREVTSHLPGFNLHGDLVLAICRVEVRGAMLTEEHADNDAEKPRDLRHLAGEGRDGVDEPTVPAEEANS
jgi:hypothetical protein